ncbi:MAPEG family protein [compost metagenome]
MDHDCMDNLLYVYALCSILLFIKMFAISCYQGFYRIKNKAFKNIEDARFVKVVAHSQELPQVIRANQAWLNDLENIPVFWVLGGLCIILNTSYELTMWLFYIFTIARVVHTITYLGGIQPWRTVSYTIGVICLFIMVIKVVIIIFNF